MRPYFAVLLRSIVLSTIIAFCFHPNELFAQSPEDLAFNQAWTLQKKLSLSYPTAQKVEAVLLKYYTDYKNLIGNTDSRVEDTDKDFQQKYTELREARNAELSKILTKSQMSMLERMEDRSVEDLKSFYRETVSELIQDTSFINQLTRYQHNTMLPTLLTHRNKFSEKLSSRDSLKLIEASSGFVSLLEALVQNIDQNPEVYRADDADEAFKAIAKENPQYSDDWKTIRKLKRKYDDELKASMAALSPYQNKWKEESREIITGHVSYVKSKELDRFFKFMDLFNVNQALGEFAFLTFDTNQANSYFRINHMLTTVFLSGSL